MQIKSRFTVGFLGGAVIVAALIAGLEAQVSAMPAARGVDPGTFDRTLKGDRLPLVTQITGPAWRSPEPPLPDGCLAAADWHKDIYSAEVAGRCVG
jgi:hypothetical protein